MLRYIINLSFTFVLATSFGQELLTTKTQKDSIRYKTAYGLRLGVDLSKPALGTLDKSYNGLEIVGDYRITKNWYIASEFGFEEEITFEDTSTSTSKGQYIRIGGNYNTYNNWLDMNNEIYVGGRYGFAIFDHTLNSYTPNVTDNYFSNPPIKTTPRTESGLTAHWLELQLGIKVETFKNVFIGFSGAYKIGISIQDQANFRTLYAPGFNRVYSSSTGFGFNYTVSYLIPFVNK